MSKPRYRWWGYAKAMLRAYPDGVTTEERTAIESAIEETNRLVDGADRMKVVELGEAYDGKLAQIKLCMNGNKNGQNIEMPFVLKTVEEAPNVQFNIPELANGTVAPEYDNYKVGDTVTLTVTPADGYRVRLIPGYD